MQAQDVMNRSVVTVRRDTPLAEAIALMVDRHVSGLPVVDESYNLVGLLTEGDLLRRVETGTAPQKRPRWLDILIGPGRSAAEYVRTHSRRVEDLMTVDVATVSEDTLLEDVVALMEKKGIKRVPVVRGDQLVGIVSRADLVRAVGQALGNAPPADGSVTATGAPADAAILEQLTADLRKQNWFAGRDLRITVHDGTVILEGIVTDGRPRDAMRVAAENVPGVKAVEDRLVWIEPTLGIPLSAT